MNPGESRDERASSFEREGRAGINKKSKRRNKRNVKVKIDVVKEK